MAASEQPGTIPISALQGRPSASADRARLEQIQADLALTPRERMLKALDLAASSFEQNVPDEQDALDARGKPPVP